MIRHIHHPSCPAAGDAGARCICPSARRRHVAGEVLAFAAMLGLMAGVPVYLLWRAVS